MSAGFHILENRTKANGWFAEPPMEDTFHFRWLYFDEAEDDVRAVAQRAWMIANAYLDITVSRGLFDMTTPTHVLACAVIQTDYYIQCYKGFTPTEWLQFIYPTQCMLDTLSMDKQGMWFDIANFVAWYLAKTHNFEYGVVHVRRTEKAHSIIAGYCRNTHRAYERPVQLIPNEISS